MSSRIHALTIAGTDPSGGAGLQADLKTFSAFGAYGMSALTSVIAQNTQGVQAIEPVSAQMLDAQLTSISDDISIDTVKIGLLASFENVQVVKNWLKKVRPKFTVLDPVIVATSGDLLLGLDATSSILDLAKDVDLITPNLPELAALLNISDSTQKVQEARTWDEALTQAHTLAKHIGTTVYMKSGHLGADTLRASVDAIVYHDGRVSEIPGHWVDTQNTHGTGCSLSAALAVLYSETKSIEVAARVAKVWLTKALSTGAMLEVGTPNRGHGPIDHLAVVSPTVFMTRARRITLDIEDQLDDLEFLNTLANGTLDHAKFAFYLTQDNIYIVDYCKLYQRAAMLAPSPEDRAFLETVAGSGVSEELEMHNQWLKDNGFSDVLKSTPAASKVTAQYIEHMNSCADLGFEILIASLLPCAFLYLEIGKALVKKSQKTSDNIYAPWIETYSAPEYSALVDGLVDIANYAEAQNPALREKMLKAYRVSAELEVAFFNQAFDPEQFSESSSL
jgi:hydroxymethylpyrimidine/phosphomethylpyrimidine kinase